MFAIIGTWKMCHDGLADAAALLAGAAFAAMLLFIMRNRKDVEPIYNLRV